MTAHRSSLRIHAEITASTCPLHCIAAAADEQASRGLVPKVVGSRMDQSGKALLRHCGVATGTVTHENNKKTPVVPNRMMPHNDLIASSSPPYTTHTHVTQHINRSHGPWRHAEELLLSSCYSDLKWGMSNICSSTSPCHSHPARSSALQTSRAIKATDS